MKKLALLFSSILIVLTACEEDFLNRQPLSEITPENYFNSEKELRLYTNSFYTIIPNGPDIYNEDADNIVRNSTSDLVSGRRIVPVDGGGWGWGDLRKINYFLEHYDQTLEASTVKEYAAIARFFRAWFYFEKVKRFGDVPFYSTAIGVRDEENLQKARDPRTLVMDSVLSDINFAVDNLEAAKSVDQVTRWTALALKSRICLFEGTFRKYHPEFNAGDAERFLTECVSAAEQLINEGPYSVYTSSPDKAYLELFASLEAIDQEVILTRAFSAGVQEYHNLNYYTLTGSQGKPGLEKKLVNSYLLQDGSRFTDQPDFNQIEFLEEVQNRDPRLSQTIRTPGYTRIGGSQVLAPNFGNSVTGYQPIKYVTAEAYDGFFQSVNDLPVFRYAEVLLNYAEAKAELGTITQDDLDQSILLLRERVGMPGIDLEIANANPDPYLAAQYPHVTGANQGVTLEIRRERRIELVMEDFRYYDLMRWKEGHLLAQPFYGMYFASPGAHNLDGDDTPEVVLYTGEKPDEKGPQYLKLGTDIILENETEGRVLINPNIKKTFDENRDYLFPIPTQERLLNPDLTQNPGWEDGL